MKTLAMLLTAAFAAIAMSACGEKPSVTVYKQGTYQGKPDNRPWESAPFSGNQAEWDKAIKARNIGQNEYARVGTQR